VSFKISSTPGRFSKRFSALQNVPGVYSTH